MAALCNTPATIHVITLPTGRKQCAQSGSDRGDEKQAQTCPHFLHVLILPTVISSSKIPTRMPFRVVPRSQTTLRCCRGTTVLGSGAERRDSAHWRKREGRASCIHIFKNSAQHYQHASHTKHPASVHQPLTFVTASHWGLSQSILSAACRANTTPSKPSSFRQFQLACSIPHTSRMVFLTAVGTTAVLSTKNV